MSRLVAGQTDFERAIADRATLLRPVDPKVLTKLDLTGQEGFLLSRVDRPMSVGDVLRTSGLTEHVALRLLLGLLEKGALLVPAVGESARTATSSAYGDFVFSPGELVDGPDLDVDRKKLILFTFHNLSKLSHFRLLEVTPLSSDSEIRKAFHEKSKLFHPDMYFRKNLGAHRHRIDAIFQHLRLAHDTLVDPEARSRYERENGKLFTGDEQAALIQREVELIEEDKRRKARRERLLSSRGFARTTRARQLLAEGDEALAKGDIATASASYQLAGELDPRLDEPRTKLIEARRIGQQRRADLAVDEAAKAQLEGHGQRAIELLRAAIDLDPSNARVRVSLGTSLAESEPKEARVHIQKAIELGERSGAIYLLHGEILLRCGLKKNARRELELAIEAGEERAKPLLKQC